MSGIKIDAFFSGSNASSDVSLSKLLDEIKKDFGDAVAIATHRWCGELAGSYGLTLPPAVVIEEMIKIMGFCPSRESLVSALQAVGLE